jgi:hypothetical protein
LDPEHGYHPAKVMNRAKEGDRVHSHLLAKGDTAMSYLDNVRFEKVSDIWVPMEADGGHDRIVGGNPKHFSKEDIHYKRTQITLNPDHDKLGSFADPILEDPNNDPELVDGTYVRLENNSTGYTWQVGMKFVLDQWDGSIKYVPKDGSILVGVGEPLPKFEGIQLDLPTEQSKGKSILICFFDTQQRSSRHCIRQLAQKASALEEKGVTVAAIQASKIDKNKLDEWIKENDIHFPVGVITADIEKTRFAWGVRSLPWLILADKEHIVAAEGFSMSGLDQKIKDLKLN